MLVCSSDVRNRATSGGQDTKSIVAELHFPERSTVVWEVLLRSRPGFKIKKNTDCYVNLAVISSVYTP